MTSTMSDARRHQLKILKLERRGLRPMATTTLNPSISKKAKLASVAAVASILLSLQNAPQAYAQNLGLSNNDIAQTTTAIDTARGYCDEISALIKGDASGSQLMVPLANLFSLVDSEHARLESFADKTGARLISFGNATGTGGKPPMQAWLTGMVSNDLSGNATGTGGKPPMQVWLNELVSSDRSGNVTGTGGKPPMQAWLNELVSSDRSGNVTGTGGKPPNLVWLNNLSAEKETGNVTGTGGKPPNLVWLNNLKTAVDRDSDAAGSKGSAIFKWSNRHKT